MSFRDLRNNSWTSRRRIWITGMSCLVIAILADGAASSSPPRDATVGNSGPSSTKASSPKAPDQARGKRLFEGQCARCHGMQGGGGIGANLRRPKLRRAADDESLFDLIQNGIPGTGMPDTWAMTDNE